jgi:hypothetical protein
MITHVDCQKKFGEPKANEGKFMCLWMVPQKLQVGNIPKKIYCNKAMVAPLTAAFTNLIDRGCVDELKTWDGCFNIREQRGYSAPSLHSWGVAIDVNYATNQLGKAPTLTPGFVACFVDAGFTWGGVWKRADGMHFQLSKLV